MIPWTTAAASVRSPAGEPVAPTEALATLAALTREIGLTEAIGAANGLLAGQVRGRLVVDVSR